jgi:putative hydrolase of the HAD superfamily
VANATPSRRLKTIFLDAGGVLVWPNWARVATILRGQGIHIDPTQLAAADPFVRRQFDAGEIPSEPVGGAGSWRYFDLVLERLGISSSPATAAAASALWAYHQAENLWEHVPEFVPPALIELRRQGLQLVVVSNANGTIRKAFDRLGLGVLVDLVIDSAEEGIEKPDPRLFQIALQRSGAAASSTLHAGDLYRIDVLGARAAGLAAVLVDEANLYPAVDCLRIRSIAELPALLQRTLTTDKQ